MLRTRTSFLILRRHNSRLSYYHRPGEQPLLRLTIGELLEQAAQRWSSREALVSIHQQRRLTYQELRNESIQIASGLLELGLKQGECVGIWAPNCVEWEITQLAAAKAGYILVNINPAYEAPELRHSLMLGKVSALLLADKFRGRNFNEALLRAVPDLKCVGDGRVESRELPFLRNVITIGSAIPPGHLKFNDLVTQDLMTAQERLRPVEDKVEIHDAYNIQFTSGTTGFPKATLLTHHGTVNNSYILGKRLGYGEKQHRICMPNPYFHCFGCVVGVLCALNFGATIVLPSDAHSPPHNIRAIQSEKCTVVYGTPTMNVDLMREARALGLTGADLGIELVVTGGALCPEQLYKELRTEFGVLDVCNVYGMTECSPVNFHTVRGDDLDLQASTVGRIAEHWEAKIVDENGRMVPFGQPGELWIRGYGNMIGYWDNPKATASTISSDGWLKTGDQLSIDEKGYGRIVGRLKDMIIRGGENIFPREVEDVLHTHPDIVEAHVYGAPDNRLGEIVCGSVRLRPGKTISPDDLKKFCQGKMAQYKIPVHLEIVDDFPKTTSGKIQKFRLREMIIEKLTKNKN